MPRPYEPPVDSPRSLAEAYPLLGGARPLAGGTDLMVQITGELGEPPKRIVDIWGLDELRGIRVEGDALVVGALTTYTEIQRSDAVRQHLPVFAEVKTTVEHIDNGSATAEFKFKKVPAPAKENAARKAKITIVAGKQDTNGAETKCLIDGKLPTEEDEPAANFFFEQRADGGRLQMDLGSAIEIKQINTYSWHPNTRGPQVYKLYVSDGTNKDFKAEPKAGTDPAKVGWKLIAKVDTRPKNSDDFGGQYGVSHADPHGDQQVGQADERRGQQRIGAARDGGGLPRTAGPDDQEANRGARVILASTSYEHLGLPRTCLR